MIDTDPFVVDSGTPGHDALLQLSSSGATFQANGSSTANVVQLANITFDVTGAAAAGTYGFKFVPNATFSDNTTPVNFVTTNPLLGVGADGVSFNRFNITAVPEPATLGLMGMAGFGSVLAWRKRRSKAAKA